MAPETEAERKALNLIKRRKIEKPPVPVEEIAKAEGARLTFEPFDGKDDISAMLFREGKSVVIGVNSAHPKTRQRFSIAHEIGHLLLHDGELFVDKVKRINFRDATSSLAIDDKEIEANRFAAELLMPRTLVQSEIKKKMEISPRISPERLIKYLASTFKVSAQAMEYRLKNLGVLITQGE
jgi:Zn-dependent peptidase ImmA (M78 family)